MKKTIIGVMGGGDQAPPHAIQDAYRLGELIAEQGWVLLNGGRNVGVMDASAAGASSKGGLVIGILPDRDLQRASEHLAIPILTGMGDARNVINVLSSDVVIACAGGAGTLSEIALALKNHRPVILLNFDGGDLFLDGQIHRASSPEEAIDLTLKLLEQPSQG
jgi:uncharacterized protein (TIGR00725 family)